MSPIRKAGALMTQAEAARIVRAVFPDAVHARNPMGDCYYIGSDAWFPGTLGSGRTLRRAWVEAAETVQRALRDAIAKAEGRQ